MENFLGVPYLLASGVLVTVMAVGYTPNGGGDYALAKAGVPLGGDLSETLTITVALGISAGLVVGKQLDTTLLA